MVLDGEGLEKMIPIYVNIFREPTLLQLFLLPSENGSAPKRKRLLSS